MNSNHDKWLIFDFDGTLADSFKMAHQVLNKLALHYHYHQVAEDEVEPMRRKTEREFFAALNIPLFKVPMVMVHARMELRRHIADIPLIKGIAEVLPILKQQGYKMGILTSNAIENVQAFLHRHDLERFFDFTYCSRDVFGKARRLKALMRKFRLDPASLIYIGDMSADVEAAHRAHVRIAAVSWGYQAREVLEKHHPTWLFDTPDQLAGLDTLTK